MSFPAFAPLLVWHGLFPPTRRGLGQRGLRPYPRCLGRAREGEGVGVAPADDGEEATGAGSS